MTIFILSPDQAHCRPFFIAQQLQTAAWGHGETETEARARMMEHRSYRPEAEPLAYYAAFVLIGGMDEMVTGGGYCQVGEQRYCDLNEVVQAILDNDLAEVT